MSSPGIGSPSFLPRAAVLSLAVALLVGCSGSPASSGAVPTSAGGSPTAAPASTDRGSPAATGAVAPRIADLPFAKVVSSIPLGPQPPTPGNRLVALGESIWLADTLGVSRVDPTSGRSLGSVSIGTIATVATDGRRLLIGSYVGNKVQEVDPATLALSGHATAIASPAEIALSSGGPGWAISAPAGEDGTLVRFDLGGAVTGSVALHMPHALLATATDVWIATDTGLARVNPTTLSVTEHAFAPKSITSLWFDGRWLWASYDAQDQNMNAVPGLLRIDPADMTSATGQALAYRLPLSLSQVASLDSLIWTTGGPSDQTAFDATRLLAGFDPGTLKVVRSFQLPPGSIMLAAAAGKLWMASRFNELIAVEPSEGTWAATPERTGSVGGLEVSRIGLSDGAEVHVIRPTRMGGLPSIVVVPGGPVVPSVARYLTPLAVALAEHGAIVYLLGYQSSASGKTDNDALADIQCAVRVARDAASAAWPPALDRVIVVGHSFGAHAAMAVLDAPDMRLEGCPRTRSVMPDGVVAAAGYAAITTRNVPIVMAYGEGDPGLSEAQRAVADLEKAGVKTTMIVRPGIAHAGIVDPRDDVGIVKIVFDLLARVR